MTTTTYTYSKEWVSRPVESAQFKDPAYQNKNMVLTTIEDQQQYAENVPAQILQQSVLNNMEFVKVDASGFHFNVSVCVPDDASCYLIDQIVDFKGKSSVKLLEY